MCYYCNKCKINWASLQTQDDEERDETYSFCGNCGSDMYLADGKKGHRYVKTLFGIVDVETRQPFQRSYAPPPPTFLPVPFDMEAHVKKMQEKEDAEDQKINQYIMILQQNGRAAAEEFFLTN